MAGYSGTPLTQKLGIKPGHRVAFVRVPPAVNRMLEHLPPDVVVHRGLTGRAAFDIVLLFVTQRDELQRDLPRVRRRMAPAAGFWVAWPKRASRVATDLTEDVVREVALPTGLVDNKVCAIDETWSGLRLVIRLANREPSKRTARGR